MTASRVGLVSNGGRHRVVRADEDGGIEWRAGSTVADNGREMRTRSYVVETNEGRKVHASLATFRRARASGCGEKMVRETDVTNSDWR